MAGFKKNPKVQKKKSSSAPKQFKVNNVSKEAKESDDIDLGANRVKSTDTESSIILDRFLTSNFNVPDEIDEFIVCSIDYVAQHGREDLFVPYFIGNFSKDPYIDDVIKSANKRIEFNDEIDDSSVLELDEFEEIEVV